MNASIPNGNNSGHARLLEAWQPPVEAGQPLGCVATSFTFSPDFFETECLSRFLALDTEPSDGAAYFVEREEKLAQLVCAGALVDQHHAKGSRNLRWDFLSARVRNGILHAKISVLLWSQHARLIVSSANLTPDGYRRNHEVFGILDYFQGGEAPLPVLHEVLDFLEFAVSYAAPLRVNRGPAIQRWQEFLDRTRKATRAWGQKGPPRGYSRPRIMPVLSGPKRATVFSSLKSIWPESASPSRAYVISPFFDPPNVSNTPARELWKLLRSRGSRLVQYEVTGEEVNGSGRKQVLLHAPCTLKEERPADPNSEVRFQSLDLEKARSLHAKCLWLENKKWTLYLMGSSNFTRAGLGIGRAVNLEANLAYLVCHGRNSKARRALESAWLPSTPVTRNFRLLTEPLPEDGEDAPTDDEIVLPEAFGEAVFTATKNGKLFLELTLNGRPPQGWALLQEDKDQRVYTERKWLEASKKSLIRLRWTDPRPPSALRVRWTGSNGCAWWPVNVACGDVLPAPEQLRKLDLEDLVEILTATGPLHKVLGRLLRKKNRGGGENHDELDPHRRVDTSQFLLQRTRRVTWALAALRRRLEQPIPSQEALSWRLNGPVGAIALAKAIIREARSGHEKCFLLAELALELARVAPGSAPGCLPKREIRSALRAIIRNLRAQALQAATSTKSIRKYAVRAFKEAGQV